MPEFRSRVPNEYHVWWDSLQEMDENIEAMCARANGGKWYYNMRERENPQFWTGTRSIMEALDKVRNGWPELVPVIHDMIQSLKTSVDLAQVEAVTVEVRRRKRSRHDYGDTLDITRVWNGQLDTAWERPTRRNVLVATQRYATIYVDLAMLVIDSFSDSLWRAALTYCIYEVLTRMGVNTEIWCGSSHERTFLYDDNVKAWKGVRIKEYTQPLTDERLAVMTSSAFHRTLGWRMCYAAPEEVKVSIGSPYHFDMVKPLRERAAAGERVFRVGNCCSKRGAIQDLNNVIRVLRTEYGGRGRSLERV